MFSKLTSRISLAAATGFLALTIGLSLVASSVHAQSTGSQPCKMEWAKGPSFFPAGTEFSIRQHGKVFTYTCQGDIGQWNEAVTWLLPYSRVAGSDLIAD